MTMFSGWVLAGTKRDKVFGDRVRDGIGTGQDCGFRHCRVLDEKTFQLERADSIVGSLEDVIRTSHEENVSILIPAGNVAGSMVTAIRKNHGNVAFIGGLAVCIE